MSARPGDKGRTEPSMASVDYKTLYTDKPQPFGGNPTAAVVEALKYLKSGSVLDMGSGDGRNSLFLAKEGYNVTAIDSSESAIKILNEYAIDYNVSDRLRGVVGNVLNLDDTEYGNIINILTMHFVPIERFHDVFLSMLRHTSPGGIHVLEDMIDQGDMPKNTQNYWFKSGEMGRLYRRNGWEILWSGERKGNTLQKDENGKPYVSYVESVIARKPLT